MLTVDFEKFVVKPGDRVLDMGCGGGRHAFELYRRGARVVALDMDGDELRDVADMFGALQPEVPAGAGAQAVQGNAYALPFAANSFDKVIAAEVLEHLPEDTRAMSELARVLKPGGLIAVTVPRWLPEKVCWALSQDYHSNEGGHVRIYTGATLRDRLRRSGLDLQGQHHAHALHAPYWWLKCLVGVDREQHPLVTSYHRMLVWDMMRAPWPTRAAERLLNPVIGKSLVVYLRKSAVVDAAA
ncbi:MAG: class I SAM-dependent methyltransferase [Mycobacteriales bacterium]